MLVFDLIHILSLLGNSLIGCGPCELELGFSGTDEMGFKGVAVGHEFIDFCDNAVLFG